MHDQYDIVVVGGGLSGYGCALKAACCGKKTLLVERRPVLGWESTWAGQLDLRGASSPIVQRILDEICAVNGFRNHTVDSPILEMALDRLARAAGISVLLYAYPVRLIAEDGTVFGVVVASRSGEQSIEAKVVVDATEDALLWRQTGVPATRLDAVSAKQTIFFNHATEGVDLPLDLGDGIVLRPSIWKGEVRVEFETESGDLLAARRTMPEVIKRVRAEVPQLQEALVSHLANEVFPTGPGVQLEHKGVAHPKLHNLFGAGIWATGIENSPNGRLAVGEEVGVLASSCEGPTEFPEDLMSGSVFTPPERKSDVLVVGGGTGGAIAAIAAGREGVQTTLIEASPALGGMGTGGAIHLYYLGLSGGIQDEVDSRVQELTPLFAGKWDVRGFHPEAKKLVLQEMAEDAGVEIHLNTVVTGAMLKGGKIQTITQPGTALAISADNAERNELVGVLTATPEGVSLYESKTFIDSTGDGDVAAMAGAPFIIGRERDNLPHAFSQSAGKLDDKTGGLRFFNFDAGYVDPTDVEDMTRGRRLGVQLYWREQFTDADRILYIAPLIGLRQGRQIIGEYQLTLADEIAGRRFDDAVSFMEAHYDNHAFDYENESDEAALWVWGFGNWRTTIGCEIPYRCMLPKNVDGVLLACRALSMTYDAHAAFRMQKDIQRIGEVAGLAAAQAVKKGRLLREMDITALQAILKARGILDDRYRPQPAIPGKRPRELPSPASLDSDSAKELIWSSISQGESGVPALRSALRSEDPDVRFKASAALALCGRDDGASELLKCVQDRDATKPDGRKTARRWQAAIPFLGMAGDKAAVPTLIEVLHDTETPLDTLIAAVRSLGRIGDVSAVPALQQFLTRPDLPTERVLQTSTGGVNAAVEDATWQLELAVAEALAVLGGPDEEIQRLIQRHLNDDRAYVRRYANKLRMDADVHVR